MSEKVKAKRGRPPKQPDIAQNRDNLIALLPQAVQAVATCLQPRPPRNAMALLAAAKTVFDRAGLPAIAATTISAPDGGPVRSSARFIIELVEAPVSKSIAEAKLSVVENRRLIP